MFTARISSETMQVSLQCEYRRTASSTDYFTILSVYTEYSVAWQDDWWIGSNLEGNVRRLIEIRSRHLPGGIQWSFSQHSQFSSVTTGPARVVTTITRMLFA
jgi:hypothetical protein